MLCSIFVRIDGWFCHAKRLYCHPLGRSFRFVRRICGRSLLARKRKGSELHRILTFLAAANVRSVSKTVVEADAARNGGAPPSQCSRRRWASTRGPCARAWRRDSTAAYSDPRIVRTSRRSLPPLPERGHRDARAFFPLLLAGTAASDATHRLQIRSLRLLRRPGQQGASGSWIMVDCSLPRAL